ncbi:MAG: FecR domain-containing protein [Kofleriaceae bacterium]
MSDQDRLGPPPVEPMTNAAWTRVERGLFERLDQPAPLPLPASRSRWPWLAIPAFALAAAAVIAIVVATRGPAEPQHVADTPPAPSPIVPSRVVAGDTPSMVSYGDAHLTVEAHAAIVMDREGSSPSVLVERGAVDFTVAPRERDTFVVRAGDVVVRVVGTQFRVARYEERVTVAVERGLVDVQFRGEVHHLSAGQSWSTPEQTASVLAPPPAPEPIAADEPPANGSGARPKATVVQKDAEQATFERLAALERKSPELAIQGYLEMSKTSSKWSANALFAAGRLAFDRKDKRARNFLTIYLKRFPRGANAEDARDLLSRL